MNLKRGSDSGYHQAMTHSGTWYAILSAALFGVSPPLAKLALGRMSPLLLAGLLYLGSGLGLILITMLRSRNLGALWYELGSLSRRQRFFLGGAIISGGIIAPLFFSYGVFFSSGFEVSALLNLETVTTSLLAWLVFKEQVSARVWVSKVVLIAGSLLMSYQQGAGFSFGGLLIALACVFWGMDNNLTRDIEDLSPTTLGAIKGLAAGTFNIVLALIFGAGLITLPQVGMTLAIGALSYGLSLVLFILALRQIGSARTSTYFSAGPFFGMLFSVGFFQERPLLHQWIAGFIMAIGMALLYRERHEHSHVHALQSHSHVHTHDEHHRHPHQDTVSTEGTHEHYHTHSSLEHSHAHLPDVHHRHGHDSG